MIGATLLLALATTAGLPPGGGETAGATSLLTAEQRAREAAERLELPRGQPSGWRPGGQGWSPAWRPPATPQPRR